MARGEAALNPGMCPLDSLGGASPLCGKGPGVLQPYLRGTAALQGGLTVEADLQEGGTKAPLVGCGAQAVGSTRQALGGCPGDPLHPLWGPGSEVSKVKGVGQPVPVPSTSWVLTLPGEGTQAHAGVAQLDEGAGALRQPQPCQQDVPATHVAMNQAFVFLEWGGKGAWPLGTIDPTPTHPTWPM